MSKAKTETGEFERGVRACYGCIIARIDNRILAARGGADEIADRLVALKRELPTVEQILAERGEP